MLEVELTSQRGPMTTRSGWNSFDLDKFALSLSRKWRQIELWLIFNTSRTSLAAYHLP